MKFFRIFPDIYVITLCPFGNSTLKEALGKASVTTPSTSIVSFLFFTIDYT